MESQTLKNKAYYEYELCVQHDRSSHEDSKFPSSGSRICIMVYVPVD